MKKTLLVLAGLVVVLLVALRMAGDDGYWRRYAAALGGLGAEQAARAIQPRLRIAGAPAPAPQASAEAEQILPAALAEASDVSGEQQLYAFIVHRHGHAVLEYFGGAREPTTRVAGGELSALPFALAIGVLADAGRVDFKAALQEIHEVTQQPAGWRNPWSAAAHFRFNLRAAPPLLLKDADGDVASTISQRVWMPLHADDAWLWGSGDNALRVDCCMVAQVTDWVRLGDLLLGQGTYQGERIASPDWIRQLLAVDADGRAHPVWLGDQHSWTGDEPPHARDTYWFDLAPDMRLWLVPRRGIAMLAWGRGDKARDTLIPNIILRGLTDQAPAVTGGSLNELVPGH
jgi:hypothetical protein